MLLVAAAVLGLLVLGVAVVGKVVQIAMRRLGLDPISVLLFFGIAEAPADDFAVRRRLTAVR